MVFLATALVLYCHPHVVIYVLERFVDGVHGQRL
jgi:hypothetical protein